MQIQISDRLPSLASSVSRLGNGTLHVAKGQLLIEGHLPILSRNALLFEWRLCQGNVPPESIVQALLIFLCRQNRSSRSNFTVVTFRRTEIRSTSTDYLLTQDILTGRICRRILTCLIPLRILWDHITSKILLDWSPLLDKLFSPFITAIRTGDIIGYDTALDHWKHHLVELNRWITIEKAHELWQTSEDWLPPPSTFLLTIWSAWYTSG